MVENEIDDTVVCLVGRRKLFFRAFAFLRLHSFPRDVGTTSR